MGLKEQEGGSQDFGGSELLHLHHDLQIQILWQPPGPDK